jgi:hypothetical protein
VVVMRWCLLDDLVAWACCGRWAQALTLFVVVVVVSASIRISDSVSDCAYA